MTIAIFVKNLTSGGAEKQSVLLAKSLTSKYDVHYIIFNGERVHDKYIKLLQENKSVKIAAFKGGRLKQYRSFVRYIKEYNINTIFSYLTAANFYACCASIQTNVNIYTGIRNASLPYFKCLIDKFLTNYVAKGTIANCFSGKTNFTAKGFNPNKIVVIPNCFENIDLYLDKTNNKPIKIITVGRFVAQKDYKTAIKSISELKKRNHSFIFNIVGYGELEEEIRVWVKEFNIEDITYFYINPNNIPDLLEQSHIYLSTSLFEGTSNSIMEAMNANLPIVATNVGDNDQLVIHEKNGYICKIEDYNTIADSLQKLILEDSTREEMGFCSKNILKDKFSVTEFTQKYIDLLANK